MYRWLSVFFVFFSIRYLVERDKDAALRQQTVMAIMGAKFIKSINYLNIQSKVSDNSCILGAQVIAPLSAVFHQRLICLVLGTAFIC